MAQFVGNVKSRVLDMETQLAVVYPDHTEDWAEKPLRVLYLLHGLSNNAMSWLTNTSVARYAWAHNMVLVLPEVQRSFYQDIRYGLPYFQYLSRELPDICKKMFGLDAGRENTFVAGLSMGGYGALKWALTCPDRFAGCASLSGAVDFRQLMAGTMAGEDGQLKAEAVASLGFDGVVEKKDDLFHLVSQAAKMDKSRLPKIFMACGRQDFLYEMNCRMRDHIRQTPFTFKFMEWDGEHTWDFWDQAVQYSMKFFMNLEV